MSADFPIKSDLSLADQQEIDRIQAIDESKRNASEQAFLDAREIYLTNEVLTVSLRKGNRSPNAAQAETNITFTDVPTDGEVVTIGDDVYEFDDDSNVSGDNIVVDISSVETADDAAVALADAIQNSGTVTNQGFNTGNFVTVIAPNAGPEGNLIPVFTTCADASWETETFSGGQDSILANQGEFYLDSLNSDLYFALEAISDNESGWNKVSFD
jgi:phage tail sheath gpL-like